MSNRTQCQQLLQWMSAGRSVTTLLAMKRWAITRTSERIRELEAEGHDIAHVPYKRGGKRWMAYRLAV